MKASINAFKGYNFQGTVYYYLLFMMDLQRKIEELDAEKLVNNNFDDIYVKSSNGNFYIQVKNYSNISFDDIVIDEDENVIVKGHEPIKSSKKSRYDKYVIFVKDLIIPNDKINSSLFEIDCYNKDNVFVVGYNEIDINEKIRKLYSDEKRYNDILLFADKKINSGSFKIKPNDLPKIYLFNQKLQEETANIRNMVLNDNDNIIYIIGQPGVGKSHLVNELEKNNQIKNFVLERLWVSDIDIDKIERLKFDNFIADISKQLFNTPQIKTVDDIIAELKARNCTLIIDGLDHVENYNKEELVKYMSFIDKFTDNKLLVFTRPLVADIKYKKVFIDNWTEIETNDYLDYMNISDYEDRMEIYRISKGYPIIVSFLAKHYLLNNEKLPKIEEIDSLNSFYDSLIKEGVIGLSIFLINNTYFKESELEFLLSKMGFEIVKEIIKRCPYLFSKKQDRLCLIHDSLNSYLRTKNPDYLKINEPIIEKISNELLNGNIGYLARLSAFSINQEIKVEVVKKYCNFDYLFEQLALTVDYEIFGDIINCFGNVISNNFNQFNLNEIYDYILLSESLKRNHHDGMYLLIVERLKYYLINDEINFDKIFSNGLLFHSLISFKERDYSPLANYYSSRFDDTDREVSEFSEALKESHEYFKIFDEKIEPEEYLKRKIKNVDISDLDSLIYLISYLYIHKKNYKKYEDVAIAIIDEKNESKAEQLFIGICREYNIRDFMAVGGIKKIKDYLFSLGVDNGDNYYKVNTLKQHIINYSNYGSFDSNKYICNYIRLANREKRKIDIESLGIYYYMYYQHKDYSLYKLPLALLIFYRRKYLNMSECINYIQESIEMSYKGIRSIMTDFYNLLNEEEFIEAKEYWNNRIYIEDLDVEKINSIDEKIVIEYFYKNIIQYHYPTKSIRSEEIENLLKSKYSNNILDAFAFHGFTIDEIPASDFDLTLLTSKTKDIKPFDERNYLIEDDEENILSHGISCVDLAKYTDGWYNTLPHVELFKLYDINEIKDKVKDIMNNAIFSFKIFSSYATRDILIGNYLLFMDLYSIADINWNVLYNSFIKFLELSLVKK